MVVKRRESILSYEGKCEISKIAVREAISKYRRPTVVWSGGKDSTVVLHMVKEVVEEEGKKFPPALFIDHGDHYPETLELLNQVSKDWNFRVIHAMNQDVLDNAKERNIKIADLSIENQQEARKIGFMGTEFEYSLETEVGNHLLKTVAMKNAVSKYRFDALFTGVRWDENSARSNEVFFSARTDPDHVRIQPILTFLEKDVWKYMFTHDLPIHPKYKEGYRSIDGIHDSKRTSDIPAWEQDLDSTSERAGRSQDKEGMMERLRVMGYM